MYDLQIVEAEQPAKTRQVAGLLRDYLLWLRREFASSPDLIDNVIDLNEWQSELADLRGHFGAPFGAILLAEMDGVPVGCAIMRGVGPDLCELKTVFVRPAFKHYGIACQLIVRIAELATQRGYKRMRMHAGRQQSLTTRLKTLGFAEIAAGEKVKRTRELALFEACTSDVVDGGCRQDHLSAAA